MSIKSVNQKEAVLFNIAEKALSKALQYEKVKNAVSEYGPKFFKLRLGAGSSSAKALSRAVIVSFPRLVLGRAIEVPSARYVFLKTVIYSVISFVCNLLVGLLVIGCIFPLFYYREFVAKCWAHTLIGFCSIFAGILGIVSPRAIVELVCRIGFKKSFNDMKAEFDTNVNKAIQFLKSDEVLKQANGNFLASALLDVIGDLLGIWELCEEDKKEAKVEECLERKAKEFMHLAKEYVLSMAKDALSNIKPLGIATEQDKEEIRAQFDQTLGSMFQQYLDYYQYVISAGATNFLELTPEEEKVLEEEIAHAAKNIKEMGDKYLSHLKDAAISILERAGDLISVEKGSLEGLIEKEMKPWEDKVFSFIKEQLSPFAIKMLSSQKEEAFSHILQMGVKLMSSCKESVLSIVSSIEENEAIAGSKRAYAVAHKAIVNSPRAIEKAVPLAQTKKI